MCFLDLFKKLMFILSLNMIPVRVSIIGRFPCLT